MRTTSKRVRLAVTLFSASVIAPLALTSAATASPSAPSSSGAAAVHGTINGFSTNDFLFADALSTNSLNLAQVSVAQSAAGVSNKKLQTTDTLGQSLLTSGSASGHNAYGRGAGVSVNLGAPDASDPKVQLVNAEATSPPRSGVVKTKQLLNLPLGPLGDVDVQPDTAVANTKSNNDFCVLGAPLSTGTGTVTNASLLKAAGITLVDADGTVRSNSTEELDPNGAGSLGLNSVATLNTAGITLFEGTPAALTIKIINPLILQAFAGGVAGSAKTTFGSADGSKDLLAITFGGTTQKLTVEQVLGKGGLTIKLPGLLNVQIGAKPTEHTSANGQQASISGDLISIQVLGTTTTGTSSVGGPLAPILNPILTALQNALNTVTTTLGKALSSLGLTKAVDLRVAHYEANSQVPAGGIKCGLPVKKTTNKDPVTAGDNFTVTISASNPYDCVAKDVRIEDKITATGGVKWTVGATHPKANKVTNSDVVWNNIGNIPPGGKKKVTVNISVAADSTAGQMKDHSHVTASCGTGNGPGSATVHLGGNFTLHAPNVNAKTTPKKTLPNTGSSPWLPIGAGLLVAAGLGLAVARRRSLI